MLNSILPASAFTAATTSPAMLGSALDLLHLAGRHLTGLSVLGVVAVLSLTIWGERHEAHRQQSINAADDEYEQTHQPVNDWEPGWRWGARPGWYRPERPPEVFDAALDDVALVEEEPVEVRPFHPTVEMRSGLCVTCKRALATTTLRYRDGETFRVCLGCAPAGVEVDAHAPTTFGRAS